RRQLSAVSFQLADSCQFSVFWELEEGFKLWDFLVPLPLSTRPVPTRPYTFLHFADESGRRKPAEDSLCGLVRDTKPLLHCADGERHARILHDATMAWYP